MKYKIKPGFTLAEIMVALAIIVLATFKILESKLSFGSRMMYYAAFTNLQMITTKMLGQGCTSTDATICSSAKTLPLKMTNASATNITKDGGFCDRIADMINIVGAQNCAAPAVADGTTDFSSATPLFKTTNSMIWYPGASIVTESESTPETPETPEPATECPSGYNRNTGYSGYPEAYGYQYGDFCYRTQTTSYTCSSGQNCHEAAKSACTAMGERMLPFETSVWGLVLESPLVYTGTASIPPYEYLYWQDAIPENNGSEYYLPFFFEPATYYISPRWDYSIAGLSYSPVYNQPFAFSAFQSYRLNNSADIAQELPVFRRTWTGASPMTLEDANAFFDSQGYPYCLDTVFRDTTFFHYGCYKGPSSLTQSTEMTAAKKTAAMNFWNDVKYSSAPKLICGKYLSEISATPTPPAETYSCLDGEIQSGDYCFTEPIIADDYMSYGAGPYLYEPYLNLDYTTYAPDCYYGTHNPAYCYRNYQTSSIAYCNDYAASTGRKLSPGAVGRDLNADWRLGASSLAAIFGNRDIRLWTFTDYNYYPSKTATHFGYKTFSVDIKCGGGTCYTLPYYDDYYLDGGYYESLFTTLDTPGVYTTCVGPTIKTETPATDPDSDTTTTAIGHTIYIDVNGSKGKSKLNEDVFKFLIYTDGTILPAVDSKGATNSGFFSASAKNASKAYIVNRVSYKEAACKAGKIDTTKIPDYCGTFTPTTGCTYGTSNECKVIINKPGY